MRWRAYSRGNRLTLARTGRINRLSGGLCDSDDFDAVKDRMATLMAAGFMSICKSDADASHSARAGPVRQTHRNWRWAAEAGTVAGSAARTSSRPSQELNPLLRPALVVERPTRS